MTGDSRQRIEAEWGERARTWTAGTLHIGGKNAVTEEHCINVPSLLTIV